MLCCFKIPHSPQVLLRFNPQNPFLRAQSAVMEDDDIDTPIFSAVASSTHHLFLLLRCIDFVSKASIKITPHGLRFSAEDGSVMQGLAFLDRSLFANYIFNPLPATGDNNADIDGEPSFLISLSAFLETLQILGLTDNSSSLQSPAIDPLAAANAFSTPALLLNRSCTISYLRQGLPLSVTLTEGGVTTTCDLTTYMQDDDEEEISEIPFQRDAISFKTIMRSAWLHTAITELDATQPTVLTLTASSASASTPDGGKRPPFFTISASGGPFSESTIKFSSENNEHEQQDQQQQQGQNQDVVAPAVAETFLVNPPKGTNRVRQSYKFSLIRRALRAMAASTKVSIRSDEQGVLSLQFMIELGGGSGGTTSDGKGKTPGHVSFIDFRFASLLDEDVDDEDYEEQTEGDESDEYDEEMRGNYSMEL